MDQTSEHVRDTYAYFGLAMYMAQVLEHELVNAMVLASIGERGRIAAEEIDSFMDKRFEKTLGKLLRELKEYVNVPDDLEALLRNALKTRNWLAHAYFRERAEEFLTVAGRMMMIEELREARDLFAEANERLDALTRPIRERCGLTEQAIQSRLEAMLEAAGEDG